MNGYEQRRQARIERARRYADSAARAADAAYEGSRKIADMIPLGQPILVGHHSEGHARRDAARIAAGMDRAVAETRRAETWRGRAHAIEADNAISSWDPEARDKIEARIAELEAEREDIKRTNTAIRRYGFAAADIPESHRRALALLAAVCPYENVETRGFPAYKLTNLGSNIRRLRERLTALDRQRAAAPAGYIKAVPNKYPGKCQDCGDHVEARAGFYASDALGDAGVHCAECFKSEEA